MALTREFRETVYELLKRPRFRRALLADAVALLLTGDEKDCRAAIRSLRDYVNGTIGFARLSALTGVPDKSLMRMLSPTGNPQARRLLSVIGHLQREEGIRLAVVAKTAVRKA